MNLTPALAKFFKSTRAQLCVILLLTFLVYAPSLSNGFVWDDDTFVLGWQQTHNLPANLVSFLKGAAPSGHEGVYRPLRSIWYSISYLLFGISPSLYHLQAIGFHLLATYLVYQIARLIVKHPQVAFWSALLFGIHPVHIEAVAWATASFDTIGVTAAIASFYLYLKYTKTHQLKTYYFSLTTAFLAFFTSEITLSLPFLIIIYDFLFNSQTLVKPKLKLFWPYVIMFFTYFLARFTLVGFVNRTPYPYHSLYLTMLAMAQAVVLYARLLIAPLGLTPNHNIRPGLNAAIIHDLNPYNLTHIPSLFEPSILFSITIISLTFFIAYYFRRRLPLVTLAITWFYLALLPVSQLMPQPWIFAERHLYLASLGFCLLVGWTINQIDHLKALKSLPLASIITGITVASFWAYLSFSYIPIWHNNLTLWAYAKDSNPASALIDTNLGEAKYQSGDIKVAHQLFQQAVDLNPYSTLRQFNLGLTYLRIEDYDQATNHFIKALEYDPNDFDSRLQLGITYYQQHNYDQAAPEIRQAIKLRPNSDQAYVNLAAVLMAQGQLDEATSVLNTALELNPQNEAATKNLQIIQQYQQSSLQ